MAQLLLKNSALLAVVQASGRRDVMDCWSRIIGGTDMLPASTVRRRALADYLRGADLAAPEYDLAFDMRDGVPERHPTHEADMDEARFHLLGSTVCYHCGFEFPSVQDVVRHVRETMSELYFYSGFVMMRKALADASVRGRGKDAVLRVYQRLSTVARREKLPPYLFLPRFRAVAEAIYARLVV
jgi:hypothetical protein